MVLYHNILLAVNQVIQDVAYVFDHLFYQVTLYVSAYGIHIAKWSASIMAYLTLPFKIRDIFVIVS